MPLNYSLSKLLARQNARQMSREQALAELQAEQARIGQVTGALGALTQAGLAAGGAAQQIGQQAGEADALALLAQQAKAKPQPVSPADELPKPVGDKPPEPAPAPVAKAEEPKPEDGAELKALLEKQRAGMSAVIDPLGKQPEPVGVPAGGVAAAGKDIASLARQATPEEPPKEEGFVEGLKARGEELLKNVGGAAGAAAIGAGGAAGGAEGMVLSDIMANEGKGTRSAVGIARDIAIQNALPANAQARQERASGYDSRADEGAKVPERAKLPPPVARPMPGEGGNASKGPPPSPPKWELTPAQQAAQILEKAKTNDTWKNILSLGGYGRGQRDGLIKAIEEQRAQETAAFDQALKVYQSTGKFDMNGGLPPKVAPRGAREDAGKLLNAMKGIERMEEVASLPEARFRTKAEIAADPRQPGEVSLEEMALNEKYQRLQEIENNPALVGFSILSEADKQMMKDYRDLDIDSRLTPQQRALRQTFATLRNEILKANAGSAQTLTETNNTLDELGNPYKYGFGPAAAVMREAFDKRASALIQSEVDYSTTLGGIERELVDRLGNSPYRLEWDGYRYVDAPDAPPAFTPETVKKSGGSVTRAPEADPPMPKKEAPKAKAPKLSAAMKKPTAAAAPKRDRAAINKEMRAALDAKDLATYDRLKAERDAL